MRRPAAVLAIGAACIVALGACGERAQVVNYQQGRYQGKPDTPPYASQPFNGDQQQWDNAIRTRTQAQNEYKRIGG